MVDDCFGDLKYKSKVQMHLTYSQYQSALNTEMDLRFALRMNAYAYRNIIWREIRNTMAMSAEPGRTKAYSVDLRWRIVWERIGQDLTYREIATNLCVSLGTVSNIMKLFETTGCVDPKAQPLREDLRKLDDHHELYILGPLYDNPALQLHEICTKVEEITTVVVTVPTVCQLLRRNGITRKKIRQVALQRSSDMRAEFIANISFYPVNQLIWVDETGCNAKDFTRKFGYALKGETPVYHSLLVRGTRVSVITAMSVDGIVAYDLTTDTVNGEKFLDFLRATLIPEMMPHDGSNSMSILIMDNCSIHHIQEVADCVGILVIFLPPYSPDLNPIEELFSFVKYYLKEHDEIIQALNNSPTEIIKSAFNEITPEYCKAWVRLLL